MAKDKVKKKLDVKFAVIVIFLLLTIATLVVAELYVWARYVTSRSGTAEAQIAEFNFQLKNINGDSTATSQSGTVQFPITRTDGNSHIAAGVLAPDTYGRFDMIIDTTGTQTSYKYDIDVTVTNCPTNLIFYSDSVHTQPITTTRTGTGASGSPKTATFTISKYVPLNRANEQHKEIVYWDWPYETGPQNQIHANDLIDSADMAKTVTMNIVASAIQVNGQPAGVATVGTASESVDEVVSIELAQNGHRDVTINNGSQANVTLTYTNPPANLESISVVSSDSSVATGTIDTANNRIVINALKAGTATITLRGEESWDLIGTVGVTVLGRVNELSLGSKSSFIFAKNSSQNVIITNLEDINPIEQFTITSSNSNITTATYDNNGTITINTGETVGTATITLTGTSSGTTKSIDIKVIGIGETVSYTTILNGQTLSNWKVFYADGNYLYIILDDYLSNIANTSGLNKSGTYSVYAQNNRIELLNAMTNASNWNSLLQGTINGNAIDLRNTTDTNVRAMGTPTLDLWVNSWNTKYQDDLLYTALRVGMSDGLNGYYIGNVPNQNTNSIKLSDEEGYNDTLYYPHKSVYSSCNGYWLASPSAYGTNYAMGVGYDGWIYSFDYNRSNIGLRPVVCLPSSVLE